VHLIQERMEANEVIINNKIIIQNQLVVTNDINYVISSTRSLSYTMSDSFVKVIPNHNLRKYYEYLKNIDVVFDQKNLNWITLCFIVLCPILSIYGLMTTGFNKSTALFSFIYYCISGLSLSIGYHRLFCHKALEAPYFVKAIYLFFWSILFSRNLSKLV